MTEQNLNLHELHPEYRQAVDRVNEIRQKINELDSRISDLSDQYQRAASDDKLAEAVAAGQELPKPSEITEKIENLAAQKRVTTKALNKAEESARQERQKALAKVGEQVSAEDRKIARRQALALIELSEAMQAYREFDAGLPASIRECGLTQFPLLAAFGEPTSNKFASLIRDALDAGFITKKEAPAWALGIAKAG